MVIHQRGYVGQRTYYDIAEYEWHILVGDLHSEASSAEHSDIIKSITYGKHYFAAVD